MTDYDTLARAFPGLREAGGDSAIAILVEGDLAEVLPDWGHRLALYASTWGGNVTGWEAVLRDYDGMCAHRDRRRAAEEAEAKRLDDIARTIALKSQMRNDVQPELL